MEKRKLGRTGLDVSLLTFGCGAVGGSCEGQHRQCGSKGSEVAHSGLRVVLGIISQISGTSRSRSVTVDLPDEPRPRGARSFSAAFCGTPKRSSRELRSLRNFEVNFWSSQ